MHPLVINNHHTIYSSNLITKLHRHALDDFTYHKDYLTKYSIDPPLPPCHAPGGWSDLPEEQDWSTTRPSLTSTVPWAGRYNSLINQTLSYGIS